MANYDEAQRLNDHELELQSTDNDNYPYIKMRGSLTWNGTGWVKQPADDITNGLVTVEFPHHEVHEGDAYWAYKSATLANGNTLSIAITTPNTTKWSHLLLQVDLTADATFTVLEGVTSFAGGTAFVPLNFNRNSSNTSGNTVLTGSTATADAITPTAGTTIWTETLGTRGLSTSRANASELILKQNSKYLFRVTNGVNANSVTLLLNWYEHTNE